MGVVARKKLVWTCVQCKYLGYGWSYKKMFQIKNVALWILFKKVYMVKIATANSFAGN